MSKELSVKWSISQSQISPWSASLGALRKERKDPVTGLKSFERSHGSMKYKLCLQQKDRTRNIHAPSYCLSRHPLGLCITCSRRTHTIHFKDKSLSAHRLLTSLVY